MSRQDGQVPPARRARHDLVSNVLAGLDDDELALRLRSASTIAVGVGCTSSVLDIDGVQEFAKRIAIADRELAHPRSTANLVVLPTSCQYGMHPLAGGGPHGSTPSVVVDRRRVVVEPTEEVVDGSQEAGEVLRSWSPAQDLLDGAGAPRR